MADRGEYAKSITHTIDRLKEVDVESHEPVRFDGTDGYQTHFVAKDTKAGVPLFGYQVVLFDDDGYYRIVGVAGIDNREKILPQFEAMARSFRRKR